MRLVLHGGFGEKGRTSIAVECDGYRLLLDAGVKTSAPGGADYYPQIAPATLRATDAIIITHGHEDHVAGLGWCIAQGFRGRIFMTSETSGEAALALAGYALPEHHALVTHAHIEHLPRTHDALVLGPLRITTGRSGHIAGGVWCRVDDGRASFCYCGDVVPASPIFAMDPLPRCDAIAIDASYGDDAVGIHQRATQIAAWIEAHPGGCVLPTPLFGRSAELLAIIPGRVALAPGMRDALQTQIAGRSWLVDGAAGVLAERLAAADDWREDMDLPRGALLCHDGMGLSGPSRRALELAAAQGHPALFTGHVPAHSPGEEMVGNNQATWIRLPTHPTLAENVVLIAASGATTILGHSCERDALARLARHAPSLRTDVATGDHVDL